MSGEFSGETFQVGDTIRVEGQPKSKGWLFWHWLFWKSWLSRPLCWLFPKKQTRFADNEGVYIVESIE